MNKNYNYIFKKIEKLLITLTTISFLLLILFQLFGNNDNYAPVFSYDQTPFETGSSNYGIIVIAIEDPKFSKVEIIKNGIITNNFLEDNEITIKVKNRDVLEVNGTMYQETVEIKIVGISRNIEYPNLNQIVNTSKSIELIGQVSLK